MRPLLVFVLAGHVLTGIAAAQSLGAVARQEEARRKTVTSGGKVYTGESLRPEAPPTAASSPVASPAPAAAAEKPAAAAAEATADDSRKDEKYWRQRISAERDALSRAELFAESLQSRINALTADFAARDDPFQRNQIGGDRQKALAELDRVRKEITQHTKTITDIQEEARKAGVPAGWVR